MKSILVHLDASPRAAERLALAQRLAQHHGAEVTATYGVPPALLVAPWALGDGGGNVATLMAEVDRTQRETARQVFARASRQGPLRWDEVDGASLLWELCERALFHDLLVLGQHQPETARQSGLPADLVPALLADSGRPALVVPASGSFKALPETVLLAWKPTREAARAASAALPWLRQATRLHLACEAAPPERLLHWLQLQGVNARIEAHTLVGDAVGDGLLSLAADTGAELLVMGCYGHSRAREWVLGGATRRVLQSMTLPVLTAH